MERLGKRIDLRYTHLDRPKCTQGIYSYINIQMDRWITNRPMEWVD